MPTGPSSSSVTSQTLGVRRRLETTAARCLPSGSTRGRAAGRAEGPVRTAEAIMGKPRGPSAWQAAATPPIMAPAMPRLPAS
ncbi:hypothetical protein [Actinomyces israelii]|uniref:hypothetical protein n=1 Tax=Actinomyces israelii TaxID=1659 RepID=UPI003C6CB896